MTRPRAPLPENPASIQTKEVIEVMRNILIIGAGDFQLPLVERASRYYNVLLAAPVVSDMFRPYIKDTLLIDVRDKDAILAYAGKLGLTPESRNRLAKRLAEQEEEDPDADLFA